MKKRKCMGIEPTGDAVNTPPNGFEDRGHHQMCRHFQSCEALDTRRLRLFFACPTMNSMQKPRRRMAYRGTHDKPHHLGRSFPF